MTNHPWQPNPQRVQSIRSWHVDQATAEAKPVAMLNFTITADHQIITKGLGIEPAHAVILLGELREVIQRIESELPDDYQTRYASPTEPVPGRPSAKVIPLRLV